MMPLEAQVTVMRGEPTRKAEIALIGQNGYRIKGEVGAIVTAIGGVAVTLEHLIDAWVATSRQPPWPTELVKAHFSFLMTLAEQVPDDPAIGMLFLTVMDGERVLLLCPFREYRQFIETWAPLHAIDVVFDNLYLVP